MADTQTAQFGEWAVGKWLQDGHEPWEIGLSNDASHEQIFNAMQSSGQLAPYVSQFQKSYATNGATLTGTGFNDTLTTPAAPPSSLMDTLAPFGMLAGFGLGAAGGLGGLMGGAGEVAPAATPSIAGAWPAGSGLQVAGMGEGLNGLGTVPGIMGQGTVAGTAAGAEGAAAGGGVLGSGVSGSTLLSGAGLAATALGGMSGDSSGTGGTDMTGFTGNAPSFTDNGGNGPLAGIGQDPNVPNTSGSIMDQFPAQTGTDPFSTGVTGTSSNPMDSITKFLGLTPGQIATWGLSTAQQASLANSLKGIASQSASLSNNLDAPQRLPWQQKALDLANNPQGYMTTNPFAQSVLGAMSKAVPAGVAATGNPNKVFNDVGGATAGAINSNYNSLLQQYSSNAGFPLSNSTAGATSNQAAIPGAIASAGIGTPTPNIASALQKGIDNTFASGNPMTLGGGNS